MEREIIDAIAAKGGKARLLGGRAVALLCGERIPHTLRRESLDIDLFIAKTDRKLVNQTLKEFGCVPETEFNLLNGNVRLMFHYGDTKIDIFVDHFQMCHRLDLLGGLVHPGVTLRPADLLLTKLQVVEINPKDLTDIAALLLALPFGADVAQGIDAAYLARCLAQDWGLWRTATGNLRELRRAGRQLVPEGDWQARLALALDAIEDAIAASPKSLAWKARSLLGDKITWYERPEEPEIRAAPAGGGTPRRSDAAVRD